MKILVVYSHYYPAFKAGGPVQSLSNLGNFLSESHDVYVLCSSRDLGERSRLPGIVPNTWQLHRERLRVFYAEGFLPKRIWGAFRTCNPDVVYVNGMFLPVFNWFVLWLSRGKKRVVAPRGMLQAGAISLKQKKKRFALAILDWMRLYDSVRWHATDQQEAEDIRREMGKGAEVYVLPNLVRRPYDVPRVSARQSGRIRLVYLSLITRKKNVHLVLEAIQGISNLVTLDIYGPIVDEKYWRQLDTLRARLGSAVNYRGSIHPSEVQRTLEAYDVFVLPSSGENFGHAIYEALSVGLPVITSPFTPWNLAESQAGRECELTVAGIRSAIEFFLDLPVPELDCMSQRALLMATTYFHSCNPGQYHQLFFDAK